MSVMGCSQEKQCIQGGGPGGPGGPGGNPGGNPGGGTDPEPESSVLDCLETSCGEQYDECLSDSTCAEILDCVGTCEDGDNDCALACGQGVFNWSLIQLSICGGQADCVDFGI